MHGYIHRRVMGHGGQGAQPSARRDQIWKRQQQQQSSSPSLHPQRQSSDPQHVTAASAEHESHRHHPQSHPVAHLPPPLHGMAPSAAAAHPVLAAPSSSQGPLRRSASTSSLHSHTSDMSVNFMHAQDEELFAELQERGPLTIRRLQAALLDAGMHPADPRLRQVHARLAANLTDELTLENFKYVIESASLLIYRALTRKLVIPEWALFTREIDQLYRECSANQRGHVASYIPELANADPNTWAVSFCSIDGQQHGAGDTTLPFSVQSCSKPLSYLMALEELGEEQVHRFVGREPSGRNFNELCLNAQNIPHNPMINAGAIMVTSLVQHGRTQADRFAHIMSYWRQLTGHSRDVAFSNTVYLSEKATANRNFCLAYLMQERKAFQRGTDRTGPPRPWKDTDLQANLDLYFQCCSIEATTQAMSVVAATLANGGVCPLTGERVFQSDHVSNCLSLMLSCGMYDYSGEWGFVVGLPAKSGVSGAIMLVIPNVGGVALLSPRLDELGNSARGIDFSKKLAQRFGLHFLNFKPNDAHQTVGSIAARLAAKTAAAAVAAEEEAGASDGASLGGASGKLCEKRVVASKAAAAAALEASNHAYAVPLIRKPDSRHSSYQDLSIAFIFACARGELKLVRALLASAVDLNGSDYDGRTGLHLAASNGHLSIVSLLVRKGVDVNPVDRLGGTPLSDAIREGHLEVTNFLRKHGAQIAAPEDSPDVEGDAEEDAAGGDEAAGSGEEDMQLNARQRSDSSGGGFRPLHRHPAARYLDEDGDGYYGAGGGGGSGINSSAPPSRLNSAAQTDAEDEDDLGHSGDVLSASPLTGSPDDDGEINGVAVPSSAKDPQDDDPLYPPYAYSASHAHRHVNVDAPELHAPVGAPRMPFLLRQPTIPIE